MPKINVLGCKDSGGCAGEGDVTGGLPWLFHHHPSQVKFKSSKQKGTEIIMKLKWNEIKLS